MSTFQQDWRWWLYYAVLLPISKGHAGFYVTRSYPTHNPATIAALSHHISGTRADLAAGDATNLDTAAAKGVPSFMALT